MVGLYGGIEAGGTKCICAVGLGPDDILATSRFDTTTPHETLARVAAFFAPYRSELAALGIGAFGPLDPRPESTTFGWITTTPKVGWSQTDVVGFLRQNLDVPIAFETDVNAAVIGEHYWGAARGLDTVLYMTVGTGLGAGAMVHGQLLHGALHPEMGHIRIPHDWDQDPFPGMCPYHGDCLEGLAAGPAIEARWGQPGASLAPDHPAWVLEAHYLALGLTAFICILAPQRLILGGGVMRQIQLFPRLRREVQGRLNGYMQLPELNAGIEAYIVPPALGDAAGVLGALALAQYRTDLGVESYR
jgi:fructokinase